MLVFISDLHFKDGTTGASISADAFNLFLKRLGDMAYRASWREDGQYKPLDGIDLVLLGDILDPLRSTRWQDTKQGNKDYLRPWHDPSRKDYVLKIEEITREIITQNSGAFAVLRELGNGDGIHLPPATLHGQPDLDSSEQIAVPVRIHYMIGNHDWYYHLPGDGFTKIRQHVIDALGLENSTDPFPHALEESPVLEELFARHQVVARHGDIFDSMNYDHELGRDAATLGDAIVVDLVDRFPYLVQERLGDSLPKPFYKSLRELGNVRPTVLTPAWISYLLSLYADKPEYHNSVEAVWDELVDDFLNLDFLRSRDNHWNPFDTVDIMEAVLKMSKPLPFETINRFLMSFREQIWGGRDNIASHALEEKAFLEKKAKYIVYGHTHIYEVVPLDCTLVSGKAFEQIYINTGTWNAYHEIARRDLKTTRFVSTQVMTYAAFYKGDERSGRSMETWSGTISPKPMLC